jgi:chromosome segregation ATPase
MDKYSDNVAKSMQVTGTLLANVYNTDAQAVSQTLNRQAQQLIELAKLKQLYEQQNDTRQVQRITALQNQLTNALKSVNSKVDEKYKTLLMIVNGPGGAQAIDKDPNLQKQLGDYRKELERARAEFNIPQLEQVLQSEMSRYTGVESNVLSFDSAGNPIR